MESSRGSVGPGAVLLVDDDPAASGPIARGLRRRGFDVAIAGVGADAFQRACDLHPSAIVVVLDEATTAGFPLVRQLATDNRTQKIPVIVARCKDDALRLSAQQIGNVVVLLGDCSVDTVVAEVGRVMLESTGSSLPPVPEFPVTCPKCAEPAGEPRSVSTAADGGTYINLLCRACGQEWRVFRRADSPGFLGKV